jgi:hypothetical protein
LGGTTFTAKSLPVALDLDREGPAAALLDLRGLDGPLLALRILVLEALGRVPAPERLEVDSNPLGQQEGLLRGSGAVRANRERGAGDRGISHDRVRLATSLALPTKLRFSGVLGSLTNELVTEDRLIGSENPRRQRSHHHRNSYSTHRAPHSVDR